ncbi:MAG: ABC transporter substrate-binding protein [Oscillospiraceae bacterium]|nr:ABC transporter substrate-binding protein [Oscillospiraceae bacterium]
MKIKKILAAIAAAAMALSVAACSSSTASDSNGSSAADSSAADTSADKVYSIGICQLVQHEALDAATKGFKDVLTEKLGDKVKFDPQNANGESTNCTTICTGFAASNVDLILANATGALQAAGAATSTIPILGTSVTDYATALDIDDWNGTTGRNISGTSDLAPIDEQAKMLIEMFPDAKTVGVLYCSAEANSKYQATKFIEALEGTGVTAKEYSAADTNEISAVTTTAAAECDVLYIPTDNTMASSTETIKNIVVPAGKPVIAGEEGICKGCGVATLSISYEDLGRATGEMAYEILVNGADISTMEIKYASAVTKKYNPTICEELGITPPEGYEAISAE